LKLVLAIGIMNYTYKFLIAIALTPLLYIIHYFVDIYLGKEVAHKLMEEATEK